MKSLIQAVAMVVVFAAPVVSFAQSAEQGGAQHTQASQSQSSGYEQAVQTDSSGYGSGSHGTWQSGRGGSTTVSSYSPPIYNAR